jgi:DNA-binding NarL/FixJ family response regulator
VLVSGALISKGHCRRAGEVMDQRLPPKHRRALIVEDEFWIAMGLEAEMHTLGFDVCDLVPNARHAFSSAMSDPPDVVLMDVCLEGGREGIEAARWLRAVCDVPVVFVTGYADRDTVERIHQQVPDAPVLHKPVLFDRLADAVAEVTQPHL